MTARQQDMGPSISFSEVGLKLGGNVILHDLDMEVAAGSIHCIIGPNGGGKTSLLKCLLGQMPHTGNIRICWGGEQTTGYVPQSLNFDHTLPLTVEDFMGMICQQRPTYLGLTRDKRSMVLEALDKVGMAHKIGRPFGGLSGGERQRVLLAQALIPEPQLLILDEPATGLDKDGAEVMHGIVRELRDSGTTVLIIHHDLAMVRNLGDAVTCINQQVLFSGAPGIELTPERIFNIFSTAKAA